MIERRIQELLDCDDQGKPGELPAHAWPGAYPMYYLTAGGDVLCAMCATRDAKDPDHDDPPVAYGAPGATEDYPESNLCCDDCNTVICEGTAP